MDDFSAGIFKQKSFCQQTNDIVTLNKVALLINQKTAIKIAIPGDTHIRLMLKHGINSRRAILMKKRIGDSIGKSAIGLIKYLN